MAAGTREWTGPEPHIRVEEWRAESPFEAPSDTPYANGYQSTAHP